MLKWRKIIKHGWIRTARRSNQSILKEISPGCPLEGLMLKLKLQYFGHLMRRVDSLEKTDAGRDWRQEEKGMTEDEMAGWHHWLDGHEFEWTPDVGWPSVLQFMGLQRVRHDWVTELSSTELWIIENWRTQVPFKDIGTCVQQTEFPPVWPACHQSAII